MKQRLTETELRNAIYERVKKMLSEAFGDEDSSVTAFILQPQYTNFIRTACHILAWKGLDFDLNIKGNEYKIAKQMIDSYISAKQEAMKSSNPKENVARVKEVWRGKNGCEGLVDSEKEAYELFKQFKEEGYEFISKYLGNKNNSSKQMEKAAGLALFGKESDLSQFHIMHGAVFCVRDFFKWVNAGKPGFELTRKGEALQNGETYDGNGKFKYKRGDAPLRKAGITGIMTNKDYLENGPSEENSEDITEKLKDVLVNSPASDNELAMEFAGENNDKDTLLKLMYLIGNFRKNRGEGFRNAAAYDKLDELASMIHEFGTEDAVNSLAAELGQTEPEPEDEEM